MLAFRVLCCSVVVVLIASATAAPLWELDQGNVGQGLNTFLVSNDGHTVWALWSLNSWAAYPNFCLLALNTSDGKKLWNASVSSRGKTNDAFTFSEGADVVYVSDTFNGRITAVAKSTGSVVWQVEPFQNTGYNPTVYGTVELNGFVYSDYPFGGALLNKTTGARIVSYGGASFPGLPPVPVMVGSQTFVFYPGYEIAPWVTEPNLTAVRVWKYDSQFAPGLLYTSSSMTLIATTAGVGVPMLVGLNTTTGATVFNFTSFNTQSSFQWGVIITQAPRGAVAVALLSNTLSAIAADGSNTVYWTQTIANLSGSPVSLNATHIAVPWYNESGVAVSLVRLYDGAVVSNVDVVSFFDQWRQSLQLQATPTGLFITSVTKTDASGVNTHNILRVHSLTPSAPVGVVVRTYSNALECTGPFTTEILDTGCFPQAGSDNSFSRRCATDNAGVVVTQHANSLYCSGTSKDAVTYLAGSCYAALAQSFEVVSCE